MANATQTDDQTCNIANMFDRRNPPQNKAFRFAPTNELSVPDGKVWLITGGCITHITATATELTLTMRGEATKRISINSIDAACQSGLYPFFTNTQVIAASSVVGGQMPFFQPLSAGTHMYMTGGAGANVYITVLEWDAK